MFYKWYCLPDEAVILAAKVLNEHLKLFIDLLEVALVSGSYD